MSGITHIVGRLEQGDAQAAEELLPLVYEELRKLAAAKMAQEKPGQTLQATALVHEAWLRLAGDTAPQFHNCAHFFGAAAEAMRRILIERARRRLAAKRGGGAAPVELDEIEIPSPAADDDQLLAVNEALEKFTAPNDFKLKSRVAALVAEDSLRSYDQINDRMYSEVLEIRSVPLVPGSSGLQLVIKPENLLEGFRPRRILRLLAANWPLSELPWEETLWPGDNRVK